MWGVKICPPAFNRNKHTYTRAHTLTSVVCVQTGITLAQNINGQLMNVWPCNRRDKSPRTPPPCPLKPWPLTILLNILTASRPCSPFTAPRIPPSLSKSSSCPPLSRGRSEVPCVRLSGMTLKRQRPKHDPGKISTRAGMATRTLRPGPTWCYRQPKKRNKTSL